VWITWGIKQHHVVSRVKASFLHQGSGDLLCSLVKLETGGCAHCYPLEDEWRMLRGKVINRK
jgi:hypothetical protein